MNASTCSTSDAVSMTMAPAALAGPWVVGRGTSPLRPFIVFSRDFDVIAVEAWDQHGLQKATALMQLHNCMSAADVDVNGVRHALSMLPRGPWSVDAKPGSVSVTAPRSTVIERSGEVGATICSYLVGLHARAVQLVAAVDKVAALADGFAGAARRHA